MTKQDLIEYIKVRVFPNMSNLVTGLNNQQALLALIDDCYNYRSIVNAVKSTSPSGITLTFSDGSSTTIPFDSAPTVPIASSSTLGAIKVGDGLSINSTGTLSTTYSYTLPVASSSVLGGIMVGGGLAINNGVLSVTATYTLPTASNSVLGGIKIGDGLTISNGFVSPNIGVAINGGTSPLFYIGQKHLIITGQGNVSVTSNNSNNEIYINYNLPIATDTSPGGIIIGDGLYIDNAGALNVSGSYSYNIGLSGNTSAIVGNNDTVKFSEGAGIDISHNNDAISKIQTFEFEIKPATTNELGGVVIGNNILIDSNGSISIPIADSDTLGLIRVGDGLDINNGVLSVEPSNDYVSLNVLSSDGQSFVSTSTVSQSSKQINLKPSGYITLGRTGTISSDKYGIVIGTDIPVATSSTFGLVKTGSNISVSGGTISVPSASDTVAGVIKLGGGLTIDQNGVASVSYSYTLPIATNDVLGGVKIGAGIAISNDGVISNSYSYSFSVTTPTASDYYDVLGGNLVIFDGSNGIKSSLVSVPGTHTVTYSGVEATKNSIGVVIVGDNIDVDTTGKISIPIASATTAGVIKLGDGLSVDSNGFVSVSNNYSFSFGGYSGSTYIKNTVNNGDSIVWNTVDSNGLTKTRSTVTDGSNTIHTFNVTMHTATASQYGTVRIGDNINVTDNTYGNAGIISVPLASDSVAGVIKVGSGLSMDSNGTLSLSSSGSSFAFSVGAGLGAPEIWHNVASGDKIKFSSNENHEGAILDIRYDLISSGRHDINFNVPISTYNTHGVIKLGSNTTIVGTAAKTYPVQLDTDGRAFVNVPWTDSGGSGGGGFTNVNFSNGSGTSISLSDGQTLNIIAGANITSVWDATAKSITISSAGTGGSAYTWNFNSSTVNNNDSILFSSTNGLTFSSQKSGTAISASYALSIANTTDIGGVIVGDNINVDTIGTISVPKATLSTLGVVKAGNLLSIDSDGVIGIDGSLSYYFGYTDDNSLEYFYSLIPGGVIIINSNDYFKVVSTMTNHAIGKMVGYSITPKIATATKIGSVMIGDNIHIDNNGKIGVPVATDSTYGVIKVGDGLDIDEHGVLSTSGGYSWTLGVEWINPINVTLEPWREDIPSGNLVSFDAQEGLTVAFREQYKFGGTRNDIVYRLNVATATNLGGVRIGNNINLYSGNDSSQWGTISVPLASSTVAGVVKLGSGLSIDSDGTLSVSNSSSSPYTLPVASDTTLGGIKIGDGLAIDSNGILSTTDSSFSFNIWDNNNIGYANPISISDSDVLKLLPKGRILINNNSSSKSVDFNAGPFYNERVLSNNNNIYLSEYNSDGQNTVVANDVNSHTFNVSGNITVNLVGFISFEDFLPAIVVPKGTIISSIFRVTNDINKLTLVPSAAMLSNLFLIKDGSWEFEYPIGKSGTYYIVVTCMYNGIWTVNIAHYGDFN